METKDYGDCRDYRLWRLQTVVQSSSAHREVGCTFLPARPTHAPGDWGENQPPYWRPTVLWRLQTRETRDYTIDYYQNYKLWRLQTNIVLFPGTCMTQKGRMTPIPRDYLETMYTVKTMTIQLTDETINYKVYKLWRLQTSIVPFLDTCMTQKGSMRPIPTQQDRL